MNVGARATAHRSLAPTLLVVVAVALAGRGSAQQPSPAPSSCPADYTIGPEDVLDIAVWNNEEITTRTVPVRPDGKISLPLLNDVQAAGFTPMQLRASLTRTLAGYIPVPTVSVIVREIHSFKVTVIGEVKTPGRYELKSRATVLDVLAMAGGPSEYAARDRIVVLRENGSATEQIPFSFEKITDKRRSKSTVNFCLQPGDIVLVP